MRIVIDLQGAQTESRFRGIGRYSLSLAQAIVRNRGKDEVILALNGLFADTIIPIREAFDGLLPPENILVWSAVGPIRECDPANARRREMGEHLREAFLASLNPDIVLITSLFEGWGDDAVGSIGRREVGFPVAVILYDLIPLISPDIHFRSNPFLQAYYAGKIASLKKSQRLLAISESARQEALSGLNFPEDAVVTISGAYDAFFRVDPPSLADKQALFQKLGITRPFALYTGGADERKNLPRLIEAFGALPETVRRAHQLVIAGKMPQGSLADLRRIAQSQGLSAEDVLLTGYVDDQDLLALYNLTSVFVFPSLHEGFGIPPLEAMACGAPVIAASASSLPEVVGMDDALFDPLSVAAISAKICRVLTEPAFRASLVTHGLAHVQRFSWDQSAKRALAALRDFDPGPAISGHSAVMRFERTTLFEENRQKILLIKLDHMGDLLLASPAISKLKAKYPLATLDIVVGSWNVALAQEMKLFDHIYTLDFFKKKSSEPASVSDAQVRALMEELPDYDLAIDLRRQSDTRFVLARIRAKTKIGYQTFDAGIDGAIDIVLPAYADIPFHVSPLNKTPISLQMLKLIDAIPAEVGDYVSLPSFIDRPTPSATMVALFPKAGNEVKEWGPERYNALIDRLSRDDAIDAINIYFASSQEERGCPITPAEKVRVHVGLDFKALVRSLSDNRICLANNSFGAHLASYLGLTVVGIYGGTETADEWAPVFGDSYVCHTASSCSPCHLGKLAECRFGLSCLGDITPEFVGDQVLALLGAPGTVKFAQPGPSGRSEQIIKDLLGSIAEIGRGHIGIDESLQIAACIAASIRPADRVRTLFVDISELVITDAKTGIQRVVRSIIRTLLSDVPAGYDVALVYAEPGRVGYRHATRFSASLLGATPEPDRADEPISVYAGDIFLGLDLNFEVAMAHRDVYQDMRRRGVRVAFVVYDLLCAKLPHCFPPGTADRFRRWLEVVAENDQALCISAAVGDELTDWLGQFGPARAHPCEVSWFHLGADLASSSPSSGIPPDAEGLLHRLGGTINFLMIGTVEPRKGHAQVLAAFEALWRQSIDVTLVIVGKNGWMMEKLVERLRTHAEYGKRLIWLDGISDEYLERIYAAGSCLIAASEGEGFGLPLIEAARHEIPIIARDLPVFREVAGDHAYYFADGSQAAFSQRLRQWLDLYQAGTHPKSAGMPWLTWRESTQQLLARLLPPADHLRVR